MIPSSGTIQDLPLPALASSGGGITWDTLTIGYLIQRRARVGPSATPRVCAVEVNVPYLATL